MRAGCVCMTAYDLPLEEFVVLCTSLGRDNKSEVSRIGVPLFRIVMYGAVASRSGGEGNGVARLEG